MAQGNGTKKPPPSYELDEGREHSGSLLTRRKSQCHSFRNPGYAKGVAGI